MGFGEISFDKRTYTVDEIQDILSIGRTSAYNLVKQGLFRSVRIGGTIRISKRKAGRSNRPRDANAKCRKSLFSKAFGIFLFLLNPSKIQT